MKRAKKPPKARGKALLARLKLWDEWGARHDPPLTIGNICYFLLVDVARYDPPKDPPA